MTHPLKVGFLLLSPSRTPLPSTRISVLNIIPKLRDAGIDAEVVFDPTHCSDTPDVSHLSERLIREKFGIAYFQKIHGQSVESLIRTLSAAGIKSVFGICDLVNPAVAALADATVVITDFLKSLYPADLHHKIHVIHDSIEHPEIYKTEWRNHEGSRRNPLRAVLVTSFALRKLPILTSPPDWLHVTIVGHYAASVLQRLRETRWTLASMDGGMAQRLAYMRFLGDRKISRQTWQHDTVYNALVNADIGIIPIEATQNLVKSTDIPDWRVKSENRLTLKMAIGLPVIASPIPAYEAVVRQAENAFLAETYDDWLRFLTALRDPDARRNIGQRARESVVDRFSMSKHAQKLAALFKEIAQLSQTNVVEVKDGSN